MKSNFQKRFAIALEKKNKIMTDISKETGISKVSISQYANGVHNPNQDKVYEIAQSLGVSPAWLMGFDVPMNNINYDELKSVPLPVIGQVSAGLPILAEENIEDYFCTDKSINADFCLKIRGDSMVDEGIFNGDLAFIKEQSTLENGEIGVILIENEATVKTFYKKGDAIVLQPANKNYDPIVITEGNVKILGKLVAVLNIRN